MTTVSVRVLKAKASEILRDLELSGEEVVITRRGKPCGRLVPLKSGAAGGRSLISLRGALSFLPELQYEDFREAKKAWESTPIARIDE